MKSSVLIMSALAVLALAKPIAKRSYTSTSTSTVIVTVGHDGKLIHSQPVVLITKTLTVSVTEGNRDKVMTSERSYSSTSTITVIVSVGRDGKPLSSMPAVHSNVQSDQDCRPPNPHCHDMNNGRDHETFPPTGKPGPPPRPTGKSISTVDNDDHHHGPSPKHTDKLVSTADGGDDEESSTQPDSPPKHTGKPVSSTDGDDDGDSSTTLGSRPKHTGRPVSTADGGDDAESSTQPDSPPKHTGRPMSSADGDDHHHGNPTKPTATPTGNQSGKPNHSTDKGAEQSGSPNTGDAFADECVAAHKVWRNKHQAQDVVWDSNLVSSAQTLANSCNYGHNTNIGGGGYGQNIGMGGFSSAKSFIDGMYQGEVGAYTYFGGEPPDGDAYKKWGHFTQIVWVGTKRLGCAKASCSSGWFYVCNYGPAGNVGGEYKKNVLSPKGG